MKLFLLSLFIPAAGALIAQNPQDYRNICTPGITLYKHDTARVMAFRLDSIQPQGNSDTVFVSYRTIRPYFINSCFDTTNGSVLGRRILKQHDGTFRFFNYNHDTLTIRAQAGPGQTWKFCKLSDTSRIDATVTAIIPDSVMGTTDSVKVITFQAKNNAGQDIPHFMNQKDIRLSKHWGLSKVYDIYFTPDLEYNDPDAYLICGKSNPVIGMQNLSWKDVYDFEVGDEFHFYGDYWYGGPSWQIMKRVLQKTVYGNMDSVSYVMEYCKILWFPQPPPNTQKTFDTITVTYNFIQMANDSTVLLLPEEFKPIDNMGMILASQFSRNIQYNGRQTQVVTYDDYERYSPPPCWNSMFEGGGYTNYFSAGLGLTYTFYMEIDGPQVVIWTESLVYFKKGSEIWGNPVAPSCNVLVGVDENPEQAAPVIRIIPNPVENQAQIILEGFKDTKNLRLVLYDYSGREVFKGMMDSNPYSLMCDRYPDGLYILSVTDDNGMIRGTGKLIISKR